jgi:hypothetical protein
MKVEDLVLIAGVAGLVFIAAGLFSRRAQAASGASVPINSLHPGLSSSEASWARQNQAVDGWTVG